MNEFCEFDGVLSVVIYESNERVASEYCELFKVLFGEVGYKVKIKLLTPENKDEYRKEDFIGEYYTDVVICDVSFGKNIKNLVGLYTLNRIKNKHPGIYAISYSAEDISQNTGASHEHDLIISKNALKSAKTNFGKNKYRNYVKKIQQDLKINVYAKLDGDVDRIWPGLTVSQKIDLFRILRKVTYTGAVDVKNSDSEIFDTDTPGVGKIQLIPEDAGRGGAKVFYVESKTLTDSICVQAVLKVSLKQQGDFVSGECDTNDCLAKEKNNYIKYVRWHLPYFWRPELMAVAEEGGVTAICYALVGAWDSTPEALSKCIARRDYNQIDMAIHNIFSASYQRWYHKNNVKVEDGDKTLETHYYVRSYQNIDFKPGNHAIDMAYRQMELNDRNALISRGFWGSEKMDNVGSYIFYKRSHKRFRTCYIHGDLNPNNIIVSVKNNMLGDKNINVSFIDFANTGRGHVFYDFIVFEVNLRLYYKEYVQGNKCLLMCEWEDSLNRTDSIESAKEKGQLCALIVKIRSYAKDNFPDEPFSHYIVGLIAFSYSILAFSNDANENASDMRNVLFSIVLAGLKFLNENENENES